MDELSDIFVWNEKQIDRIRKSIINLPMSDQDTIIVATNRINAIEYSREKSRSLLGRLSQWLVPENLDQIASNPKEIHRLCEIAGIENKEDINIQNHSNGDVLIDHVLYKKIVRKAIGKLSM